MDADNDGIGDVCDNTPGCGSFGGVSCEQECIIDSDCDSIQDFEDNCPVIFNPEQEDTNDDGIGEACDIQF